MPYLLHDKLEFISEAGKILSSSLDYNVTLASVAQLVVNNIADLCVIDIIENDIVKRVVVKTSDTKNQKIANEFYKYLPDPSNKEAVFDTAKIGRPIVIKNITKSWLKTVSKIPEEIDLHSQLGLKSIIFSPLVSRGKVIGVLTFASSSDRRYTPEDSILAYELSSRAGIAVDKARLYKEAQDAIRSRDEFLSIASHELRTPLTSILLNLQLILSKIKKTDKTKLNIDEIIRMVEASEKQSWRMTRLISDLTNISVLSTGRFQLEKEELDIAKLVHDLVERSNSQHKGNGIQYAAKGVINCVGDKVRLEQVFSNLISNAIKYGNKKPIKIKLIKRGKVAVFTIQDNGVGIKKEDQERIFDRFERAATKEYKGLGVGLYITHEIVTAHKGHIEVESKLGKGSLFTVTLPLR